MQYVSTRGQSPAREFCDILLGGLAPDGGLYLPEAYPQVSRTELDEWRMLPYHALALRVLEKFITDIPACDLKMLADRTYSANVYRHCRPGRDAGDITPLTTLEPGFHLLELSNGPTLAFKDMAMQLLGHLFEYVLEKRGETINILGATSGDTGSAAEYAMRGKHRVKVFMLSPEGKMSAFQRAQIGERGRDGIGQFLRLRAAGAGMDGHDGVLPVFGLSQDGLDLFVPDRLQQPVAVVVHPRLPNRRITRHPGVEFLDLEWQCGDRDGLQPFAYLGVSLC